jgi:tetratricopeptide (TPR) repeat protein
MFFYANMLRDHGKRQEALDMYKRSLALNAVNGPALFNAAVLSAKLGDMTSAQQYLTGLKSIDPQLARKVERYFTLRLWL